MDMEYDFNKSKEPTDLIQPVRDNLKPEKSLPPDRYVHTTYEMEILAALQKIGLPKHITRFEMVMQAEKLTEITCTFYPERVPTPLDEKDYILLKTKKYKLVEIDES